MGGGKRSDFIVCVVLLSLIWSSVKRSRLGWAVGKRQVVVVVGNDVQAGNWGGRSRDIARKVPWLQRWSHFPPLPVSNFVKKVKNGKSEGPRLNARHERRELLQDGGCSNSGLADVTLPIQSASRGISRCDRPVSMSVLRCGSYVKLPAADSRDATHRGDNNFPEKC